jgi:hypothetical protein
MMTRGRDHGLLVERHRQPCNGMRARTRRPRIEDIGS